MSGWITVTVVLHSLEPPRFGLRSSFSNALITVYKVRVSRGNMCLRRTAERSVFAQKINGCSRCNLCAFGLLRRFSQL